MKRLAAVLLSLASTVGCGGGSEFGFAEVEGTLLGNDFNTVKTVYHGENNILLFVEEVDCDDVWWVKQSYRDGDPPNDYDEDGDADLNFVALQFSFETEITQGTFSVSGDSAAAAIVLENTASGFDTERANAENGILTITEISDDSVVGEFDVYVEDDDDVVDGASGSFETAYCRNMK